MPGATGGRRSLRKSSPPPRVSSPGGRNEGPASRDRVGTMRLAPKQRPDHGPRHVPECVQGRRASCPWLLPLLLCSPQGCSRGSDCTRHSRPHCCLAECWLSLWLPTPLICTTGLASFHRQRGFLHRPWPCIQTRERVTIVGLTRSPSRVPLSSPALCCMGPQRRVHVLSSGTAGCDLTWNKGPCECNWVRFLGDAGEPESGGKCPVSCKRHTGGKTQREELESA